MGKQRLLFGLQRNIVWEENVDSGGMFDSTIGVFRTGDRFRAFVEDGWSGGVAGKTLATLEEANRDLDRLMERYA